MRKPSLIYLSPNKILTICFVVGCLLSNNIFGQVISNTDFEEDDVIEEAVSKAVAIGDHEGLRKEADLHYSRMEYIKAARKYEKLAEKAEFVDAEIMERLGNCYYYNSNFEKSSMWYGKIYETDVEQLSTDGLFRYIHALKGVNNYNKSRIVQRQYNARVKQDLDPAEQEAADALLEELLNEERAIKIVNLEVNTPKSDFSPMFLGDKVVFSSNGINGIGKYGWDGNPFLDLFEADMNSSTGQLENTSKLPKSLNSKYHEASVSFSPDGNTIYFTRNNHEKKEGLGNSDGINKLMILKSERRNKKWKKPKILPFNKDEYSFGHPAISPDGKKLYFVSDMPGTLGKTDIYVVEIDEKGSYSTPMNLGAKINTKGREMFPFVTNDKLYFASDGHLGLGGLDIYVLDLNEENPYVRNLGKPFNSNKDDFSFIINENNVGYFASNRKGGKGNDDIYYFDNNTEELVAAEEEVEEITSEIGTEAEVNTEANEVVEEVIAIAENEAASHPLVYEDEKTGERKLKISKVLFDFDKSFIKNDAKKDLELVITFLKENENARIQITSHTDSRGRASYNQKLSERRAQATKAYLLQNGVSEKQIESAVGFGESQLINECADGTPCSRSQHYLNRRSEFIVTQL